MKSNGIVKFQEAFKIRRGIPKSAMLTATLVLLADEQISAGLPVDKHSNPGLRNARAVANARYDSMANRRDYFCSVSKTQSAWSSTWLG